MKNKRIEWVDIYKGILIFLVVLGHCHNFQLISYIYTFHMAAFFFISGYTSDYSKLSLTDYIKRKFKSLMVPFFVVNTFFLFIQYAMSVLGIYKYFYPTTYSFNSLINFFKYFWTPDFGGATWFLVVLFFASVCSKLIYDLTEKSKHTSEKDLYIKRLIISSILLIVTYYLFYSSKEAVAYFLDLIPMSLFFVTLGNTFKNVKLNINKVEKTCLTIFSLALYVWYAAFNYQHIEWTTRSFPNIIIMVAVSLSGILLFSLLAKGIVKLKDKFNFKINLLDYLGKHSLAILVFHFLALRIIFVALYLLKLVDISQLQSLVPTYTNFFVTILTAIVATILSLGLEKLVLALITLTKKFYSFLKNHYNVTACLLLTALVFVFSSWTLTSKNFFVFDDYNNLATLPFSKFSDIISILPTDVYCSRSGGWVVVKILLNIFGTNYLGHIVAMLLLHSINACLVYFIALKILHKYKEKRVISLISALIFALYPVSTFASFWEAGMFDLFGFTLTLISTRIYIAIDELENKNKLRKIILSVIMILVYYISLRTKEMFIGLPAALLAYSFIRDIERCEKTKAKFKLSTNYIKEFLKKNSYLLVMIVVMFAYFIYSRYLNSLSAVTHNIKDAYYYTFNPLVLIEDLFIYIYAYFTTSSLVYGNVTDIINYTAQYKMAILIVIMIIIYLTIKKLLKKDYSYLIAIGFFLVLILPVLPMPNMHHVLYLYAPSAFLAIIIANLVYSIIKRVIDSNFAIVLLTIFVLLLINHSSCITGFRTYWTNTAYQDKKTYNYLLKLSKKYKDKVEKVYVINVPKGYTSFTNGPGFIINSTFNNPKIKVYINQKNYDLNDEKILVIDYNKTNYKVLKGE